MKRYEMLDVIWEALGDMGGESDNMVTAHHILTKIEEAGMTPPPDKSTTSPFGGHMCQWEYDGEYHE